MIVEIKQVKSNFENKFEVLCNNEVVYYAETPWMNISLPFNSENVSKLNFYNKQKNVLFTTNYRIIDNAIEEAIPFKYLITGGQNLCRYEIVGKDGIQGSFFTKLNGLLDSKFCIEYDNKVYLGYDFSRGKIRVISIFDGEKQVAQITKPLATIDNLDIYYLHLQDDYNYLLPILSFFTVYFDYRKYGNKGRVGKSSSISYTFTYDKNAKKYNSKWIKEQFGQEVSDKLNAEIKKHRAAATKKIKRMIKIIGICFFVGYSIIGIIILLLWKNGML